MGLMSRIRMRFRVILQGSTPLRPAPPRQAVSGRASLEKPVDDLVFHPDDLTLTPASGNRVRSEASKEGIGDLIFNPEDHTFLRAGGQVPTAGETLPHCYQLTLKALAKTSAGITPARLAGLAALFALLGIISYFAFWDSYRVDTRLLFFQRDNLAKVSPALSLEREVEMLKNLDLMVLFAGDVYGEISGAPRNGARINDGKRSDLPKVVKNHFRSASDLGKWLEKAISVDATISNGVAKVGLSLKGNDPELLKAVMAAYVSRYAEHRLMLEDQAARRISAEPQDNMLRDAFPLAGPASEQFQKIELQERGCELALKLIDHGKGVFSGFVPDGSMAGTPSLSQFQEKIVQLEIKKRALEVQFTGNAREVRAVDLEIQGVKAAMRECLAEHLEFLKQGREQLLAQHDPSGLRTAPTGGHYKNRGPGPESPESATDGPWVLIRDGLYMLRDRPRVAKKPLLFRAGSFKRSIVAYLSPSGSDKTATKRDQTKISPHPSIGKTSGNGSVRDRLAGNGPELGSRRAHDHAASNAAFELENGSRVNNKPRDKAEHYWESVPASHFGRKSLW